MNILILSVGTRNKIIQYFVKELSGKGNVVATDMSTLAPALYEADKYYIVPQMTDKNYLNIILEICANEKIDGVLSRIDPELSYLAKYEEKFKEVGTQVIGSSEELCELALDKFQMFRWLYSHGYPCARSYINKEEFYMDLDNKEIQFPVFVKPIRGSASISISKVFNKEMLEILFAHDQNLMIQEFLDGQEIGADVYIDMCSGNTVSIFTKRKIKMRAGETDKAVSFKDDRLFEFIEHFVKDA